MGKVLREALIMEVFTSVESAMAALDADDVETAKWALGHGGEAMVRFSAVEAAKPQQRKKRQQQKPQRSKPRAQRNGRVPVGQRRAQVMELLHREDKPLTTEEIATKLGASRNVVAKATKTIDADLLNVVKGKGRQPTRYALASAREKTPA